MQVPVFKKDAKVQIEINYNILGSIANSLFIIAGKWSPEEVLQFKETLKLNDLSAIKNVDQITYLFLDSLYRAALKKAEETGQVEFTEMGIASPLSDTPTPQ